MCPHCGGTMLIERHLHYGEVADTYRCVMCGRCWDEQIEANRKEQEEQECRKRGRKNTQSIEPSPAV